jgi:hypothetical protein
MEVSMTRIFGGVTFLGMILGLGLGSLGCGGESAPAPAKDSNKKMSQEEMMKKAKEGMKDKGVGGPGGVSGVKTGDEAKDKGKAKEKGD